MLGAEGFTSDLDQEVIRRIERQLKNRFPIGCQVSEQRIIQDFLKQVRDQHFISVFHYKFASLHRTIQSVRF